MEKSENIQSRGELVHFQLSRVALRDTPGSRDTRIFRLPRGPSETRSRHRFPHVAILAFKSSDLFVVYLSTLFTIHVSDVETTAAIRPVEHNSVGILFLFLFPLNLFYGLQHASINVYNAARLPSPFMPLESLHDWKKPTEYKLIKTGRYRVLDRQWRRLFSICYIGSGELAWTCRARLNARIFLHIFSIIYVEIIYYIINSLPKFSFSLMMTVYDIPVYFYLHITSHIIRF